MARYTSSILSAYIEEVSRYFDKHVKDLQDERLKTEESINNWAETLHFQINEHAKEQKTLLQSYCSNRQGILHAKKQEIVDEMCKWDLQYHYDQMRNILEQCRTLKFELLVEFDYENQPLSFIQCVTKEHLAQKKKNESNAAKTGNYISEAKLELKDSKNPEKNIDPHTDLSHDPTAKSGQQTA
jgi:hypothetical protein